MSCRPRCARSIPGWAIPCSPPTSSSWASSRFCCSLLSSYSLSCAAMSSCSTRSATEAGTFMSTPPGRASTTRTSPRPSRSSGRSPPRPSRAICRSLSASTAASRASSTSWPSFARSSSTESACASPQFVSTTSSPLSSAALSISANDPCDVIPLSSGSADMAGATSTASRFWSRLRTRITCVSSYSSADTDRVVAGSSAPGRRHERYRRVTRFTKRVFVWSFSVTTIHDCMVAKSSARST
mmetsp:Transcript_20694/g.58218  ORF Transcript_20694/g.58218 Transcript_20694/m.58218 type:complete len:241 (+) Transcript_20694:1422-2144(+)